MKYEVEQKFPVSDLAAIVQRLTAQGSAVTEPTVEIDLYFNHPSRDFAATDEALRIRAAGARRCITYKGPKIDATTKTRRELELKLDPAEASQWAEMLQALGFRPVAEVRKERRKAHVAWQGREVEVSLDEVAEVGQFVELELIADEQGLTAAKECLATLAAHLNLGPSERRSYLELLLLTGSPLPDEPMLPSF